MLFFFRSLDYIPYIYMREQFDKCIISRINKEINELMSHEI